MTMEQESGFLSNENKTESEKVRLSTMLKQILEDLNSRRMTTVIGVYVCVTFGQFLLRSELLLSI
jgi:hypothetical protein